MTSHTRGRLPARRHVCRAIAIFLPMWLAADMAGAQFVAIAGDYAEALGPYFHLPQNTPSESTCSSPDARCFFRERGAFGVPPGTHPTRPATGVRAIPRVLPGIATSTAPISIGDAFEMPPMLFQRDASAQQVGIPRLPGVARETGYEFALPATGRALAPPAETRSFARRNFTAAPAHAFGQNNGLATTDPNYVRRSAIDTTVTFAASFEVVTVRYKGGLCFSGTAAALLRGAASHFRSGPGVDHFVPASLQPAVDRIRATFPTYVTQHGAGWSYVTNPDPPGSVVRKGFPNTPNVIGPPCAPVPPPSPAGCQQVIGFDTYGTTLAPPTNYIDADVTRHLFAWTTGTVSLDRSYDLGTLSSSTLLTGMGYDSTVMTSMSGTVRRIGLVAGAVTERTIEGDVLLRSVEIMGMNLQIVPEPGARAALFVALATLASLGRTRGERVSRARNSSHPRA